IEAAVTALVVDGEDETLPMDHRVQLRKSTLACARRRRDWPAFDSRLALLQALDHPIAEMEAKYEQCLRARDEIDYFALATGLRNVWNEQSHEDPVWILRRAA